MTTVNGKIVLMQDLSVRVRIGALECELTAADVKVLALIVLRHGLTDEEVAELLVKRLGARVTWPTSPG